MYGFFQLKSWKKEFGAANAEFRVFVLNIAQCESLARKYQWFYCLTTDFTF